ncbi:MAG TPA: hypothetical protein VFR18_13965 [Terriglobia bacterium]|nr:hypothetical protein [Terriglobia bacterium]
MLSTYTKARLHLLFGLALLCGPAQADDYRDLKQVKTVYILGMVNGLDQFLANRLTNSGAIWVVLDPVNADAILTDRLDEDFWKWLTNRYPRNSANSTAGQKQNDLRLAAQRVSPGTIFLVDPRTRLVLWSAFESVRRPSGPTLDQAAGRYTKRLQNAINK